jgi:hypothetical protein
MKNKRLYAFLIILFPIVWFYVILWLYNIWFDTYDKIKYDPTYSPEFDQDKGIENIIYWSAIVLGFIVEVFLIRKYMKIRRRRD